MAVSFTRLRLILYACLTIGYLIHWTHDDLAVHPDDFTTSLFNNLWQVICIVGLNIFYFEYVLPFATSGKVIRGIFVPVSIVLHVVLLGIALYVWRIAGTMIDVYHPFRTYADATGALLGSLRFVLGSFLVFAVCKLLFDYTQLKYESQQARLEKKQAELLFLKSQINPHFLFNTLNNIYSLSQYHPHLVSESVLRLSKILRYLLYEASHEYITIDKEIRIVTDYIDLEKLRYNESVAIDFRADIDDPSELIPPLLLMPLVENAFKHGVSATRGKRFVDVVCTLRERKLHFVVRNSIPVNSDTGHDAPAKNDPASDPDQQTENIGLTNLTRRLNLLYKTFELNTDQKDSVFTAELTITLSSHV
jgi:two-component system, LytTR family, sensor kinase